MYLRPILPPMANSHDKDTVEHVARSIQSKHQTRCSRTCYVHLLILTRQVDDANFALGVIFLAACTQACGVSLS